MRILIVEDQPAVREVISEVLAELGCDLSTIAVGSLKEAARALEGEHWDALITDMSLTDGNILDLIERLNTKGRSLPPAILMSGFLTAERMAKALQLGISQVLAKPFDPEVLLKAMEKLLNLNDSDCACAKPRSPQRHSAHRLLPEMFEMDRHLGLVYRMFDELPGNRDVSDICDKALELALDMLHGRRGFLALYDRPRQTFIKISEKGLVANSLPATFKLKETPFAALMDGSEEFLQVSGEHHQGFPCCPVIDFDSFVALAIQLQGVPVGVICMLDSLETAMPDERERQMLGLLVKKLDTLLDNRAVHAALAENMRDTLIALVRTLEARDRYTKDHSSRVGHLASLIAEGLGLDADHVELIRTGGLLHDIGKVGVPDAVLLKPGRYTDHEFAIMKAHPAIGDNILKNMDTLVRERLMVRHHHERWDGMGYPDKLAGEEIPLDARIVCVADAIDAMTTHRVYRLARPLSFCLEQLKCNAGTQFDPDVVGVAIGLIESGQVHTQASDGEGGTPLLPKSANISVTTEARHYA